MPPSEDRFNRALTMLLKTVELFIASEMRKHRKYLADGKDVQLYAIEDDKIHNSSIRYSADNLE